MLVCGVSQGEGLRNTARLLTGTTGSPGHFYQTGFSFSSDIGAFVGSKIGIKYTSKPINCVLHSSPGLCVRVMQFSLCSPLICGSEVRIDLRYAK